MQNLSLRVVDLENQVENFKTEVKDLVFSVQLKEDLVQRLESTRKVLLKQLLVLKGTIRVYCRVRPLIGTEKEFNPCVSIPGNHENTIVHHGRGITMCF